MPLSRLLTSTTGLTIEALFKMLKADIRVHDIESVPKGPVLYVINHFTRIETLFFPAIIKKHLGNYTILLADKMFFGGNFGKLLNKLGAVSTDDPDRDKILTRCLLTGQHSVVIFPEGQMLKDKKIIEKGKYLVYNSGIRRPPHTGAANIALRSEFYRHKLRYFLYKGDTEGIEAYRKFFQFKGSIEKITELETVIVPVNITYYPIRAEENAIKNMAEKLIKNLPDRFEEELEVEGTMLMEGVDIDINFGKPIEVRNYYEKLTKWKQPIESRELLLNRNELKLRLNLKKAGLKLMHRYMDSIYMMTTVNHDHVFASILTMYPKKNIDEDDFKNRSALAIEKIKETSITNFHTSLIKKQTYMHTDDFHMKYQSFIDLAVEKKLITVRNGRIIRNNYRFSKIYEFHKIRQDNIIEVLKNEIEPMQELLTLIKKIMFLPVWRVRKQVRNTFYKKDLGLFKSDYKQFCIENESKPENIGRPFFLKHFINRKGVILVHGYMAAPEEMRVLGKLLYDHGYTVYGVRLRGHGTSPEDLASRRWEEWYESVNRGYIVMKNLVKHFAVIGFSTGAGLALLQAANKQEKFKAIISISAPLELQDIRSRFASAVTLWNIVLDRFNIDTGKIEYVTNTPENTNINYFRNPVQGIRELGKLMNVVRQNLSKINTPTLIIQGMGDPVVNPVSGKKIYDLIGTYKKELFEIESKRHGIVRGEEFKRISSKILHFLDSIL